MTKEDIVYLIFGDTALRGLPVTQEDVEGWVNVVLDNVRPTLPSSLDKAADKYIKGKYSPWLYKSMKECFKAGAEWLASQGHTLEMTVKKDAGGYPYIDAIELYDYDEDKPLVKEGDKVIVNIRKK